MDPEDPICMQVDVKLHPTGPQLNGALEGGEGILGALTGGAAVGNDFRTGHAVS
jgi:hypothetical protein